ncbi:MAG: FemAB family PEP-CTERM system-associated protein [Alphaproteobacteria bacterium]|nr:FemAB family PEP-CTERM system-associated protein [Alphaproteobacteria bacterium]
MLETGLLATAGKARWDEFVSNHPAATIFHHSAWADVMQNAFGHRSHFITVAKDARLTGVLPLVELKSRLFGHALISTAFCVGGGPLATDDESRALLLREAEALGRKLSVGHVELRDTGSAEGWIAKDDLYAGFEREMIADEAQNLLQIPRKQRAVVRKAIEGPFRVTTDKDLDTFYALFSRTVRDHGTPVFSKKFFHEILQAFPDNADILTIWQDDKPLSSVLSYYFRDRVYPYYTGSNPEARGVGSNDLMYWKLMRHAVARGCRIFDFGRSKVGTGPFAFKKNWGFEPRPIAHQFLLVGRDTLPNLNPTNPRYVQAIEIWRRLPLPVANFIAPFVSRNLG